MSSDSSEILTTEVGEVISTGNPQALHWLVLAHGAGAGMRHPFMEQVARGIAGSKIRVLRFEFPYMQAMTRNGKRRPPPRVPVLVEQYLDVLLWVRTKAETEGLKPELFIGGKSMGGRVASLIADQSLAAGLVCFGYPFHPVGKPDKLRTEHLAELQTRTLILQGERDSFGNRQEVTRYSLSQRISLCWLADGDHSLKPRRSASVSESENFAIAIKAAGEFIMAKRS